MIYILLIVILPPYLSVALSLLVGAAISYVAIERVKFSGEDLHLTVLLAFVLPGLGFVYLGVAQKALFWYLIQIIGATSSYTLHRFNVDDKSVGLCLMIPFICQLFATGLEYNRKYGGFK